MLLAAGPHICVSVFCAILAFTCSWTTVTAASVATVVKETRPWEDPCVQPYPLVPGTVFAGATNTPSTLEQLTSTMISNGYPSLETAARKLQNAFGISMSRLSSESLPGLPTRNAYVSAPVKTLPEFLLSEYQRFSRVAVFVEQMKNDDNLSGVRIIRYERSSIHPLILEVESELYALLCQIKRSMKKLGLQITEHVQRSIITDEDKYYNSHSKYDIRDVTITREIIVLVNEAKMAYATIASSIG